MDQEEPIRIKSKEGDVIEFKNEFKNLSKLVQQVIHSEVLQTDLSADAIRFIQKFCEAHNYNEESMTVVSHLKSEKLSDNIDPISFEIMKDYSGISNEQIHKIRSLIYAAYHLDFQKFKDIVLATLGSVFYVGDTAAEIENYKKKWDISDITLEEEKEIILQNQPVFNSINSVFEQKLLQEQQKYFKLLAETNEN